MDESVEKVAVAAADMESAQFQLDNSSADLRDVVIEALSAGVTTGELATASGLSSREIRKLSRPNGSATGDPDD